MTYISRPRIIPDTVERRAYQETMADAAVKRDTLLILPTGLGKTIVALMVSAEMLERGKKVLILAPTKPLVEQHHDSFSSLLTGTRIGTMNGNMQPEKRLYVMENSDLVVSTPQVVSNDLDCGRYTLRDFGLIVYDEAHRAVGNYAYVNIARYYERGLTLGMTASPGSDVDKIMEVCGNLGIQRIDARSDDDPDVSPYIHDVFINRVEVNMPEDLTRVISLLNRIMDGYISDLKYLGLMEPNWPPSTKHMLVIGESLQRRLARGERTAAVFRGLICQAACVKILHAIGLAETQGMSALRQYIFKLDEESRQEKGAKASKEIVASDEFKEISRIVRTTRVEHPKISRVMGLVSQSVNSDPDGRVIVFTQYRDTCDMLLEKLSGIPNVRAAKLIGQANGGLKQKEQVKLLDDFRSGVYNTVVSTSVGEEGLDIASTDVVIFYEPIPSEIRTIQRRGRTGRKSTGEVYVLIAKGTRDEIFERTSQKKEDLMKENLENINSLLMSRPSSLSRRQTHIDRF